MQDTPRQDRPTLDAETFFGDTITTFAGALEDMVGLEDASGFVSRVGNDMGIQIGEGYRDADGHLPATLPDIADILADLKGRIGGCFEVSDVTDMRAVLVGHACPFGARVAGRPSLCMMTTNVFGRIAADATGYAAVTIEQAIALGHPRCRVVVDLARHGSDDAHEFFR